MIIIFDAMYGCIGMCMDEGEEEEGVTIALLVLASTWFLFCSSSSIGSAGAGETTAKVGINDTSISTHIVYAALAV